MKSLQINLSQRTTALGRNGHMHQKGMSIDVRQDNGEMSIVRLAPINSKDMVGQCFQEIPHTNEDISNLIYALQQAQAQCPFKKGDFVEVIQPKENLTGFPHGTVCVVNYIDGCCLNVTVLSAQNTENDLYLTSTLNSSRFRHIGFNEAIARGLAS